MEVIVFGVVSLVPVITACLVQYSTFGLPYKNDGVSEDIIASCCGLR